MRYFLFSLLLFLLSFTGLQKPVYTFINYLVVPLQFGLKNTASNIIEFQDFYTNISLVRRENMKLLENQIILESHLVELKRYEEENKILRAQLELETASLAGKKKLLVNVMGNPSDTSGATLIIDKGSTEGVTLGDNIVLGAFLVGKVSDVNPSKSTVQLITSPDSSITVYNLDSSEKTEGLAIGKHGFSLTVEKILPGEKLDIGDVFVTSGKDGTYLPGLYVGKVVDISKDSSQPLKSAALSTILDVQKLSKVFVILQK